MLAVGARFDLYPLGRAYQGFILDSISSIISQMDPAMSVNRYGKEQSP
jgi:hypothetical protein